MTTQSNEDWDFHLDLDLWIFTYILQISYWRYHFPHYLNILVVLLFLDIQETWTDGYHHRPPPIYMDPLTPWDTQPHPRKPHSSLERAHHLTGFVSDSDPYRQPSTKMAPPPSAPASSSTPKTPTFPVHSDPMQPAMSTPLANMLRHTNNLGMPPMPSVFTVHRHHAASVADLSASVASLSKTSLSVADMLENLASQLRGSVAASYSNVPHHVSLPAAGPSTAAVLQWNGRSQALPAVTSHVGCLTKGNTSFSINCE